MLAGDTPIDWEAVHTSSEVARLLPLRDSVPLPDTLIPLAVGQERSVQLVNDVLAGDRRLAMVASLDPEEELPGPEGLHRAVSGNVALLLWRVAERCARA